DRAVRGGDAGRARHAFDAASPFRRVGGIRTRTRAPDFAIVQQSESHLRGGRGHAGRPAAAPARVAGSRRRIAHRRFGVVRPELAGTVWRGCEARALAVVAATTPAIAGAGRKCGRATRNNPSPPIGGEGAEGG